MSEFESSNFLKALETLKIPTYVIAVLHFVSVAVTDLFSLNVFMYFWRFYQVVHTLHHAIDFSIIASVLTVVTLPLFEQIVKFSNLAPDADKTLKKFIGYGAQITLGSLAVFFTFCGGVINLAYLIMFIVDAATGSWYDPTAPNVYAYWALFVFTILQFIFEVALLIMVVILFVGAIWHEIRVLRNEDVQTFVGISISKNNLPFSGVYDRLGYAPLIRKEKV